MKVGLLVLVASLICLTSGITVASSREQNLPSDIVGLYVHQHWPYKHPYASRTWTVADWRGYASGLKKIGYNTIMIWPMLDTMPDPLTPSDRASLEKHAKVIDILHDELGMRVLVVMCPNVIASNAAGRATFETRKFYWSERFVDPGDRSAVASMMVRREKLLRYLKSTDGVVIIDSDPGGYPRSTNADFVDLLNEHRQMLDRLRRGIELDYWILAGWQASSEFYGSGVARFGTKAEFVDTLNRLKQLNPEPWGLADGFSATRNLHYVEEVGLESRVIAFNYGAIEGEPSMPLTQFGRSTAYDAGSRRDARGVMGSAQTHVVQLPNIFAFSRGAQGRPVTESDYVWFADQLVSEHGRLVVDAWMALSGEDPARMRNEANAVRRAASRGVVTGSLSGLIFADAKRFMVDLALQLELQAACRDVVVAGQRGGALKPWLLQLALAAEAWQNRTGYQSLWVMDRSMDATLRNINSPKVNDVLDWDRGICIYGNKCEDGIHYSGEAVDRAFADLETFTPRLISAIREAATAR
jgi:hypothetical protein